MPGRSVRGIQRARLMPLLLVALLLAGLGRPTSAETLDEYRAAVEAATAAAERARASTGEVRAAALAEARRRIEAVQVLELGGTRVSPDNAAILADLGEDGDLDRAVARLRALAATLDAAARPQALPREPARAALDAILARQQFRDPGPDLAERALGWAVRNVLAPVINFLLRSGGGPVNPAFVAGLLALTAVFGVLTWHLRGALGPRAWREAAAVAPAVSRSVEEQRLAEAAATRQDFRQALHHLYLALLYELDDTDRLRFDPSLTNRELVRASGAGPDLVALVDRYDATWYSVAPVTAEEYRRFHAAIEALRPGRAGTAAPEPAGAGRAGEPGGAM